MSVYVDFILDCIPNENWKYDQSCHMIADSEQELVEFAKKIGLKPKWLQRSNRGCLHFDLTVGKRKLAIKNGAIELERHDFVVKRNEIALKDTTNYLYNHYRLSKGGFTGKR